MNTVYLFRHGEVEAAYQDCFRGGQLDCGLSDAGLARSEEVAQFLSDQNVTLLITTGLKRTDAVANYLADETAEHRLEPRLREIDFGAWDGLTATQIEKKSPQLFAQYYEYWHTGQPEKIAIPDGESITDVSNRVAAAWNDLLKESHKKIGIISHSLTISCLLSHVLKKPLSEIEMTPLGGGYTLKSDGNEWTRKFIQL